MIPFPNFRRPGIAGDSQRCDDKHLRDYKIVQKQILKCRQCDYGLSSAEAHIQE